MSADERSDSGGLDRLRKLVALFPELPGVYVMRDEERQVIYVGKAKSLRDRVRSYFGSGDGRVQIPRLMQRVRDIDTIVTQNEPQAFILERDLISRYKPRYNIRLKDDKAYLSIRVDENVEWPRLELVRKTENDDARYFGPFSYSYELRQLLEIIKRVIPLRTCSNTILYNRQRPCLEYQIKRCSGPCCLPVDRDEYREWVRQAISILEGRTDKLERELTASMERAAEELRFEDAAVIRDRIEVLQNVKKGQQLVSFSGENRDAFGLYREERIVALAVVQSRGGRLSNTTTFTFTDVEVSDEEVLESALTQYYEGGREIPEEILIPFEIETSSLIAETLHERKGRAVEIAVPQRGVRHRLLSLAQLNARQHFSARFDAETRAMEVAKTLSRICKLRQVPRKIECVDISNLQGSDIVGALTSFFDGMPEKAGYRKYRIKQQGKPDDFAAIHEVVTRRLSRGKAEEDLPDLLVIDGGAGQLREALRAREEVGVELDIIALAKFRVKRDAHAAEITSKPERIYLDPESEPILLEGSAPVTHLLQRIRDETHRYVITFHRTARSKRVFQSVIDTVGGIGPERRARLFRGFGSVEQMERAAPDELARVGRMPLPLAHKLLAAIAQSRQARTDHAARSADELVEYDDRDNESDGDFGM